jgi:hypothetical protein
MNFNLHQLGRKFGQRANGRLFIPGAAVAWKLAGQEAFSESRSPLSDLSTGGLAFLTNNPPDLGSEVTIRVTIPPKSESFELQGEVKYSEMRGAKLTFKYRIGVELHPFKEAEGCNNALVLDKLKALEKALGKNSPQKIRKIR